MVVGGDTTIDKAIPNYPAHACAARGYVIGHGAYIFIYSYRPYTFSPLTEREISPHIITPLYHTATHAHFTFAFLSLLQLAKQLTSQLKHTCLTLRWLNHQQDHFGVGSSSCTANFVNNLSMRVVLSIMLMQECCNLVANSLFCQWDREMNQGTCL